MTTAADPRELEHRTRIHDALLSYCRGIDRLHAPSIEAAFHPGAMLEGYGAEQPIPIEAFIPNVIASLGSKYVATQHRVSNIAIELMGDRAMCESYILAYHVIDEGERRTLVTFNGRYIDWFERRDDEWRIARRQLRIDWSDISPLGAAMTNPFVPSGRGDDSDPIFA